MAKIKWAARARRQSGYTPGKVTIRKATPADLADVSWDTTGPIIVQFYALYLGDRDRVIEVWTRDEWIERFYRKFDPHGA